jgi:hypothetical protein
MNNTWLLNVPALSLGAGHEPMYDHRGLGLLFHAAVRDGDRATLAELEALARQLTPDYGATDDRRERDSHIPRFQTRPLPE